MNKQIVAETLSPEDALAFKDILNALVFKEPRDIIVSKDTILDISQLIQDDFIDVFNEKYDKFIKKNRNLLTVDSRALHKKTSKLKFKLTKSIKNEMIPKKFFDSTKEVRDIRKEIKRILCYFIKSSGKSVNMYNKVGFTPKIMSMNKNPIGGLNCMGTNLLLGSFLKKIGLQVKLAITAEHPFLVTEIENRNILVDGVFHKKSPLYANGAWKHAPNYSVYYPYAHEYPYNISYVGNFDKMVVYETLENLQAMKEFLEGNRKALLPGYIESFEELLPNFKDLIQKGNWRRIQNTLFPEIYFYFLEHASEWKKEFLDQRKCRDVDYTKDLLAGECINILDKTKKTCGITDKDLKKISDKIYLFFKLEFPFLIKGDQYIYIQKIFLEEEDIPYTLEKKQITFVETLILNLKDNMDFRHAYSSAIAASLTEPYPFENISEIKLTHINLKPWEYLEEEKRTLKQRSPSEMKLAP
jgi:hypothetical protein